MGLVNYHKSVKINIKSKRSDNIEGEQADLKSMT